MQLFGTKPNQVPTNSDLGGMAYLDPNVALPLGAMPLITGSPIIENGANSNGSYIRFADGTQVCYRSSANTSYPNGSTVFSWTFPSVFTSNPTPFAQYVGGSSSLVRVGLEGITTTTISGFIHNTSGSSQSGVLVTFAIGRWK